MAQKVNAVRFSRTFKKQYSRLPKNVQNAFDEKLAIFMKNLSHPGLRVKKIQGTNKVWEGSVTMNYRFTFHFDDDGNVVFRLIGTHDILQQENR
jgi:mRNA interferase RelE/StbE